MKKLITAAFAFGGAIMISQSAFGQAISVQANEVYLGFQNNVATADYIINLGTLSSILGQSSVVNLSGDISSSDFSSVNNGSGTTLAAVVGAANNVNDAFGTITRTANIGNPAVAGSTAPTGNWNYSEDQTVYSSLTPMHVPTIAGAGSLDSTKSWSTAISPIQGGNYYTASGFNPNSTVTTSSVVYEDLYLTTDTSGGGRNDAGNPWVYQGYFTIDFTGSSPKLTFSSTNVPATIVLSKPVIVSVTEAAGTATLVSTNALASHSYQLQYTSSLTPPIVWSSVGSAVTAATTRVTNTDSTATSAAKRFYRVEAQ